MKKLLTLALLLCTANAWAISDAAKYELNNHMGVVGHKYQLGSLLNNTSTLVKATYNYATMGGTIGDKSLAVTLPSGAIVTQVYAHVLTAVTGGGTATIALFAKSEGDLMSATAISSFGSTTTLVAGVPVETAATMIVLNTGAKLVRFTLGGSTLTAGKIDFFIKYHNVAN